MRINKRKLFTLFALTTLIAATLLFVNMNIPTSAQPATDLIYLHGPSLTPIHMNSNMTLTPMHMHHTGGILQWDDPRLYEPNCTTDWTQLYPDYDPYIEYHLSSWEDNGDYMLSPNDQIDLTDPSGKKTWYHVDRMTVTLLLSPIPPPPWPEWPEPAEPTMAIELKWPKYFPEIKYDYNLPPYLNSTWHEVWPTYSNIYNLTSWQEDPLTPPTFKLDPCDVVDLTDNITGVPRTTWWHVEDISTDLILREKIIDPICTWWHQIYPEEGYCTWHHITSWENQTWYFSPCDQIDMTEKESGNVTWYHVDRITITINVTWEDPAMPGIIEKWMKLELKTPYYEWIFEVLKYPWFSLWHEVYPRYSNVYNLTDWDWWEDDNCNGVLDPCDYIWLQNMTTEDPAAVPERWHIEDMTYDLILNKKITDPVCTDWHELYPDYCNWYHVSKWTDNDDGLLSPCDYVNLTLQPGGTPEEYHVENVTITLNVTSKLDPTNWIIIEFTGGFELMYPIKTEPNYTIWHGVYPESVFCNLYNLTIWDDDCNGVLSYCDYIVLEPIDPPGTEESWHVEEVAIDMVVKKEVPPPPPPPMYWKESYPDYAPSGVPDFDERQDAWFPWGAPNAWTWCAPTAVANSLWWMDSRFETGNTPPPSISDTFKLLTNYLAAIDDHDPSNVQPFIEHLAWLMDTDGNRTGDGHMGTRTQDIETGIAQYLSWSGVNPLGDVNGDGVVNMTDWHHVNAVLNGTNPFDISADIWPETVTGPYTADNVVNQTDLWLVGNHTGETGKFYEKTWNIPDFYEVDDEVKRCEDVVLVLGFWNYIGGDWVRTTHPIKELGHCVTVAGINSTLLKIAISDPENDAFEAGLTPGRSPVNHAHPPLEPPYTTHNNASLVSHDIYNVTLLPPGAPGKWALKNYIGCPVGSPIAIVEAAIIVSPLPVEEVCGVDITNVVTRFKKYTKPPGVVVNQGYRSWTVYIDVTAHNNGTLTTSCTVNAYYHDGACNWVQIGTQNIPNWNPCNTTTLTFKWNLSTVPLCNRTVKVNATCPCGGYDEFITHFKVKGLGDVDNDGTRGVLDVILIFINAGPSPPASVQADVDGDCTNGVLDVIIIFINAGPYKCV